MKQLDPDTLGVIASFLNDRDGDALKYTSRNVFYLLSGGVRSHTILDGDYSYLFEPNKKSKKNEQSDGLARDWALLETSCFPTALVQINALAELPFDSLIAWLRSVAGYKNVHQLCETEVDVILEWSHDTNSTNMYSLINDISSVNIIENDESQTTSIKDIFYNWRGKHQYLYDQENGTIN